MPRPLPPFDPPPQETAPVPPHPPFTLLRQLQYLPSGRLDRLVEGWLTSLGFRSVTLWERRGTISTYEARYGSPPFAVPARVRVHQRLRRLEISHVESFLGHLVRSGSPLGILVTPGECSWAAGLGARTPNLPYLRLCGGAEWAEELRAARRKEAPPTPEVCHPAAPESEPPSSPPAACPVLPCAAGHRSPGHRSPGLRSERRPEAPCGTGQSRWHGGYRVW